MSRRMVDSEKYGAACEKLWTEIQTQTGSISGKKILVIGTEEFMFPVLYIGRQLEKEGEFCEMSFDNKKSDRSEFRAGISASQQIRTEKPV